MNHPKPQVLTATLPLDNRKLRHLATFIAIFPLITTLCLGGL
jgi:hypothetical protein